jgi:uncharacterized protein involved in outer membrane biogenesis
VKTLIKWWKFAAALLLALVTLQVAVSLVVRTGRASAFLTRQLRSSFGRSVEVRSYSASLFPTPRLDAYGITVGEDPNFGHEYLLRADRLSAGLRWTGFLRGRFELGTLQLERPSLILARNSEGRWNLERWLPATLISSENNAAPPTGNSRANPAHNLQKLYISDGRANFKLGDDKTSFAFIQVEGSVEQTAPGRWQLDLQAEPQRSGVPLQLAGTVRVRGNIAGTSARLQPARFQVSWQNSSLADVFRLIGGSDLGVRGVFAAEGTLESGGVAALGAKNAAPGDWSFSVKARASGIHRWDLTERSDNPRIGLRANGRWNPANGTLSADEFIVESPHSNMRGTVLLNSIAESHFELRMDSAGIQAADLVDWYRAFYPGVSEEIRAEQYFTGAAIFRGWPFSLSAAAFSSPGGHWSVPDFASPFEVKALRGGSENGKLTLEPFVVSLSPLKNSASNKIASASGSPSSANLAGMSAEISLLHDFATGTGGIRIAGQATRLRDVFSFAKAFGRRIQNGWELNGKVSGDLRWDWSTDHPPAWNGHADLSQASLQMAGLNQPVQLESLRAEWGNAKRKFTLGKVSAFGANWTGFVEQPRILTSDLGESEIAAWTFQLRADHLDAADLDRWMGPRGRPNWLQRLLPSGLGGASSFAGPSVVLQRIRASGDLRIGDVAIEKIKLMEFHAQAKLDSLKLNLRNIQAQWSGGEINGALSAAFSPVPKYEMAASFDRVVVAQTPWLAQFSDHLAGSASGNVELSASGIGRDALLSNLAGKGEIRLGNVELRGWDVGATLALGEWQIGTSRWTAGTGTFHLSDAGFDLNSLRLTSLSGDFLLKGSVSFSQIADLTAESHSNIRTAKAQTAVRYMQISGPLAEPRVSLERTTVQQPGD